MEYADGRDERVFVIGGFVASTSSRTLTLQAPVPGGRLDWADRASETVRMAFSKVPLAETTPGGPVILQALLVIFVYTGVLWKTPATP